MTIRQRPRKIKKRGRSKRIPRRDFRKRKRSIHPGHGQSLLQQKLSDQAAVSYNQGFDAGYDEAWLKAEQSGTGEIRLKKYEEGYKDGLYDGGEGIVDSILPEHIILPEITVRQLIEAGVEQWRHRFLGLLSATEVNGFIQNALNKGLPLSIVRLGDGELLTLAQETAMDAERIRKEGHFLPYAGVRVPDLEARNQLVDAVQKADIVGIPKLRLPNFQPLAITVFKAHGIDYRKLRLTQSTINYSLYLEGFVRSMLERRRVLVVGNASPGLAQALSAGGVEVAGSVSPVEGVHDVPRVLGEISVRDFDIALVSAGIPAVMIVQRIASELKKVAIDFGHLADSMANGEIAL